VARRWGLALAVAGWVVGAGLPAGRGPALAQPGLPGLELAGQLGGVPQTLAVAEPYAYVGIGPRLAVLAVAGGLPRLVGWSAPLPGLVRSVAVAGGYAYVCAGPAGELAVVDLADPAQPRRVGGVATPGDCADVALQDGYAYVADGAAGGLRVVDVSDAARPRLVAALDTPGAARDVAVGGGRVLVADAGAALPALGSAGLVVLDATDPARPRPLATLLSLGAVSAVEVLGDRAYVATTRSVVRGKDLPQVEYRLRVLDLTQGDRPRELAAVGASRTLSQLSASGERLVGTSADGAGYEIFDIA
jgi:hypothetical protein